MANALYDKGREGFLDGTIDWDTGDIRAMLVDNALYTVDLANHDFLNDVTVGEVSRTVADMTVKTVTGGTADAAPITFSSVAGPTSIESIVIYQHTGVDSTARLIAYIDTATGLPVTSNGGDITVTWDGAPDFIFTL